MRFTAVEHAGKIIGYSAENRDSLFFFGTAFSDLETLQKVYPNLIFSRIKQVHGDALVPSSDTLSEADAHWTEDYNRALVVATADCIPVLISHEKFVCSIHAGWRGIANEIVMKACQQLNTKFESFDSAILAFGPHIHQSSFEVDQSLAEKFKLQYESYHGVGSNVTASPQSADKAHVDLKSILQLQLAHSGVHEDHIFEFPADTKADVRFFSFRRQRDHSGRNLSFVSRLKK